MRCKINLAQILPTVSVVLGAIFAWVGISTYGLWHPVRGPTAGMYPSVMGMALVVVGIIDFVRSFKDSAPVFGKRDWLLILAVAAVILVSYVIGLLVSLGVFLLLWLVVVEKQRWRTSVIVMLVMAAITYVIFIWWLQVPFEEGLFSLITRR